MRLLSVTWTLLRAGAISTCNATVLRGKLHLDCEWSLILAMHAHARNFEETRREGNDSILWRSPRVASPRNFARPTIAITKIRDYSQSKPHWDDDVTFAQVVETVLHGTTLTRTIIRLILHRLMMWLLGSNHLQSYSARKSWPFYIACEAGINREGVFTRLLYRHSKTVKIGLGG